MRGAKVISLGLTRTTCCYAVQEQCAGCPR